MTDKIPRGWQRLVDDMLAALAREYPDVRILSIENRGWLHVDYALPTNGVHDWVRHAGFDRWLQRYVTQSLSTCMWCGSVHGRDRGDRRIVICDQCEEKESCNA